MSLVLRPSQALPLWSSVTLGEVLAERANLTMRQQAILLIVYLEAPPHTVRGLAASLGVTKPVVTRALDTLGDIGLVSRHRDPQDKRSVLVRRTAAGALYVEALGDAIVAAARNLAP